MRSSTSSSANVIRFEPAPSRRCAQRDQRSLMDLVYTAGSIPVAAEDRHTKAMAARLQVFGFLAIEEIGVDGKARRLRPSEAVGASLARPWRLSKRSFEDDKPVALAGRVVPGRLSTVPALDASRERAR